MVAWARREDRFRHGARNWLDRWLGRTKRGAPLEVHHLQSAGNRRIRLYTLTVARSIAAIGQLFAILFVHISLGIHLPLVWLLPAVLISALSTLFLQLRYRATASLSVGQAVLICGFDVIQLAWLLAWTGGLQNPFSLLIILPVALGAATLSRTATLGLTALAALALTVVALLPVELPWFDDGTILLPAPYILAVLLALLLALVLIAAYVWNIAEDSRLHAEALNATQLALAREQELSSLGGQAAAVAHLLGTPLATINVIARELVRELPADSHLAEDAAELLEQAKRCRSALASLGERGDDREHRRFISAPLSVHLRTIADQYARPGVEVVVDLDIADGLLEPEVSLYPGLRHSLANLIDNAIQFASSRVELAIRVDEEEVEVLIEDDGQGFSPEVLDWLGEPWLSTRRDAGGMGLGIFIANTLLARTGARLHFDNGDAGARVRIIWPRGALENAVEEGFDERRNS